MNFLKTLTSWILSIFKNKKALFALIFFLISYFILFRGGANEELIETSSVERKDIASEVFATGKIESENDASLNFPISGKVVWINVKEGDYVQEGQAIASLDKERYEIALRQSQQDVIAADAVLEKTYDDLPDNDVESFQDKINRTAAEKSKNQAFDALKLAQRNLKDTVLNSPVSGTVIELNINVGDEILVTETVARVADTQNIEFLAQIDEADIGDIETGQQSLIYLDAYPEEEIQSVVTSIGNEGEVTATQATVFEVTFEIQNDEKYIIGMNGDVQITTSKKENILAVPIEAIFDENKVFVKEANSYHQKEVEIGIQNDLEAEIISGLKENEVVVVTGFNEIGKESIIQKILP